MSNYRITIEHPGLNKARTVTAKSEYELETKINAIEKQWEEQWAKKQNTYNKIKKQQASIKRADDKTLLAEKMISEIENMLVKEINLKSPKLYDPFYEATPKFSKEEPERIRAKLKSKPKILNLPVKPSITDEKYFVPDYIFNFLTKKKEKESQNMRILFESDLKEWEKLTKDTIIRNEETENKYKIRLEKEQDKIDNKYKSDLDSWKKSRQNHQAKTQEIELKNKEKRKSLREGLPSTVEAYYNSILNSIDIPINFKQDFNLKYIPHSKQIYLEFNYPDLENMPLLKKVTYVKSSDTFKETKLTNPARNVLYEKAIYNLTLKLINTIFKFDNYRMVDFITLNGFVTTINPATGQLITPCFMSLVVNKKDFKTVNLQSVDPKEWFKNSKGVAAAKITSITPVQPIISINKEDSRFVDAYDVMHQVEIGTNLASMDWKDFENLIRELFEQEFKSNNGEVKITQASKDGGVDAIAFDPDPIRGGKIVIQAKRYTNVVGVSAVRDLYGTVMNEGATKGILVTTSDYGSDSYNFSKDKPITLLNGANLLHLLEKHGTKAYIDIKEAKKILNEE